LFVLGCQFYIWFLTNQIKSNHLIPCCDSIDTT
jgi:hypothetical protein